MILRRKIVLHVLLPLLAGGIIYILLRPETWIGRRFAFLNILHYSGSGSQLFDFIKFTLPDFFWSYSLASALVLWSKWASVKNKFFPFFVLAVVLMAELIQLFLTPHFTFDWIDAGAAVLAFLLSYRLNL